METGVSKIRYFQSGGREIRLETCPSHGDGARPSVLLLHGANGVRFVNPVVNSVMQFLAGHGFMVHLLHYFDRTNTVYADDAAIHENFSLWLETVQDGIRYIQGESERNSLTMFGHSLGGYLTAATVIQNAAIRAAVILSGGIDEGSARAVKRTAPVLIFHGSSDSRVPISEARRFEAALSAAGGNPEFHVYPGEGHVLALPSYADVTDRAARFLKMHGA